MVGGKEIYARSIHLEGGKMAVDKKHSQQIFVSPSIHYSGGDAYATPNL